MSLERPRFLADAMLGDVARWLRILGEDCAYASPEWRDADVLRVARGQGRLIVSRDSLLVRRARREEVAAVEVPQAATMDVLVLVYDALGNRPERVLEATRCAVCNGALSQRSRAQLGAEELGGPHSPPADVVQRHNRFWLCGACGRWFWRGSHWEQIERQRSELLARLEAIGG